MLETEREDYENERVVSLETWKYPRHEEAYLWDRMRDRERSRTREASMARGRRAGEWERELDRILYPSRRPGRVLACPRATQIKRGRRRNIMEAYEANGSGCSIGDSVSRTGNLYPPLPLSHPTVPFAMAPEQSPLVFESASVSNVRPQIHLDEYDTPLEGHMYEQPEPDPEVPSLTNYSNPARNKTNFIIIDREYPPIIKEALERDKRAKENKMQRGKGEKDEDEDEDEDEDDDNDNDNVENGVKGKRAESLHKIKPSLASSVEDIPRAYIPRADHPFQCLRYTDSIFPLQARAQSLYPGQWYVSLLSQG